MSHERLPSKEPDRCEPYLPGYEWCWSDEGCHLCDATLGRVFWPKGWPSDKARSLGPRFFYCDGCDTLFCFEAGKASGPEVAAKSSLPACPLSSPIAPQRIASAPCGCAWS